MRQLLGTSCRIGSLTVKNRIVMEAMGNALGGAGRLCQRGGHLLLRRPGQGRRGPDYERGDVRGFCHRAGQSPKPVH